LLVGEEQERKIQKSRRCQDRIYAFSKIITGISAFVMPGRKRRRLTEDLPTLAQPSLIPRIDDKDDGVTLVIVFFPDLTDIALTAQVEKVQGGRREGDLSNCEAAKERIPFGLASSLIESARAI
jgi:hypothetical protein